MKMRIFRKRIQWLFAFIFLVILTQFECASYAQFHQPGQALYWQIESSSLPWEIFARSVEGRNIRLLEMGSGKNTTLIMGGFHGSEPLSVQLTLRFASYLYFEYQGKPDCRTVIVPCVNPDGLVRGFRTNAHGVDLNRNFPTANWTMRFDKRSYYPGKKPASEPETKVVMALIEKYQPDRIVSIHTPLRMVNYDGPAYELAVRMALLNGYPATQDVGYATPGSLGSYAGAERNIPTITLELPRESFQKIWEENREALLMTIIYSQ
ncbi:MAG: murein peptide amidase A [Calditrichaeota bacterium]|nr:murein peptide amidase A [Calditrichota bacterium]